MIEPDASPLIAARPRQRATRVAFFIAGLGMAAWAPLVPVVQARLALDAGTLGLLLLGFGGGSIVAMPMAGRWTARFGCRRVLVMSSLGVAAMLPLLAGIASVPWLAAALFVFGASIGSLDCAANVQAVIVERQAARPMMSGFHALFSLGGIAGSAGVSALLAIGVGPATAAAIVAVILLVLLAWAASDFLGRSGAGAPGAGAWPRGPVWWIGLLCFVVFLTEGAMLDWSAVLLVGTHQTDIARAGLGYAAFATAMTIGRLTGDRVVRRLGAVRVLAVGGALGAVGLAATALLPDWRAALAGCALVGAGCANIVPVLYSAIGRQRAMPESAAVPAVTAIGYTGILAGPAAIGFVAHATSLPAAFLGLAVLLVGVAASGRRLPA